MEHNGFYSTDNFHKNDQEGRGGNAFATIIIIIVIVLLALMVSGLFWPSLFGGVSVSELVNVTPTPSAVLPDASDAPAQEATTAPEATPTPIVSGDDREMPALDGIAPTIPGMVENPIPDIYDAVSPGVVGVLNYQKAKSVTGKEIDELYGSGTGFAVSSAG